MAQMAKKMGVTNHLLSGGILQAGPWLFIAQFRGSGQEHVLQKAMDSLDELECANEDRPPKRRCLAVEMAKTHSLEVQRPLKKIGVHERLFF